MPQNRLDATLKIDGNAVEAEEIFDLLVDLELDQPDMAAVTFSNQSKRWSEQVSEGSTFELSAGHTSDEAEASGVVFKGEVTGIEPIFQAQGASRVTFRALNALHKLSRGKKSVSYKSVSDQDLVNKICSNNGLTADYDGPTSPTYDHVYQHNQTDLEFIRLRAARVGCEIRVEDNKLSFKKRSQSDSGVKLTIGESGDATLERFAPRLSTANQVSKVEVHGWDPKKKEKIVGTAEAKKSNLGDKHGTEIADSKHSNVMLIDTNVAVYSIEEAKAIAESLLKERLMNFIVGDAVAKGNPKLKPGMIITIQCGDKRFEGKYYLTAVRHRFLHDGPEAGFRTFIKFKRDARGDAS
jgi:phage protein D